MQFKEFNVKSILALFIIVFGMVAMCFLHLEQMVLGALIGFIGQPMQYFFGSSKGSEAKDKTISDLSSNAQADAPDGDPIPGKGPKG